MSNTGLDFVGGEGVPSDVKKQFIQRIAGWSHENQCRELQKLATYINDHELGGLSSSAAACDVIRQLFPNLEPDLKRKHLSEVLPVLDGVVRDYKEYDLVQRELAAAAMIIICMNDPDKASSLGPTVAALLEASASSRSRLERVKTGEHVDLDYILQGGMDQDNTTINTSTMLLLHFKKKLPVDTWAQIESSLSQELRDEFELIWDSIRQTLNASIMPLIHFKWKLPDDMWAELLPRLSQALRNVFELTWDSILKPFAKANIHN